MLCFDKLTCEHNNKNTFKIVRFVGVADLKILAPHH